MKVGVYASLLAGERGHESNVSGHIQVPLHSVKLLHEAGHEVHLITTRTGPDRALPRSIPDAVRVHLVEDGRRRPDRLRGGGTGERGLRPVKLLRQTLQVRGLVARERLEVLHAFGLERSAAFAGALKAIGLRAPAVATLVAGNVPARPGRLRRALYGRLDAVLTATEFAQRQCAAAGMPARLVRHGVVRHLAGEVGEGPGGERHRVLFWRDPNRGNGADLCAEAFDRLAPVFPDVSFDFAIRPTGNEVDQIAVVEARHRNVHVHRFPYAGAIGLPELMAEALLVVLPFRALSMDPQLAIAESLDAGVPVITTDVRSNAELVREGETGMVVPAGAAEPIAEAIDRLLADRPRLLAMGSRTTDVFRETWHWDAYVRELEQTYEEVIT